MIEDETRLAIEAALARSDEESAATLALGALAAGQRDVLLLQLGARQRARESDLAAAHAMLADALEMEPGNVAILTEIAALWRLAGNAAEALRILDAMIAQDAEHAPMWRERGHALQARGAFRDASEAYRRAIAADPSDPDALAGAAETALQRGEGVQAEQHAEHALVHDPDHLVAGQVLAQLDLDRGNLAEAQTRLTNLLQNSRTGAASRIQSLTLLGDALDGLGEVPLAFDAYAEAQRTYRALHAPVFGDEQRGQRALIEHVRASLAKVDAGAWRSPLPSSVAGASNHLFLLGYPRSGTTLVENILASLPDVIAIEERPTLAATMQPLLGHADGMKRVAEMDQTRADHFRRFYWDSAHAFGGELAGRTLVDMDPLKGIYLPIIARLFPHARIVVMRRDPREVVWSCFKRNFQVTPAAYAFSDLESTARHYDALMALTQECLDRLPIDAFILRYDELVTDFETVTRQLCAFAGLEWSDRVADFARTAGRRGVATASARQVTKGLYDGTDQWRRYEAQLRPILPILQPWVERFGFRA